MGPPLPKVVTQDKKGDADVPHSTEKVECGVNSVGKVFDDHLTCTKSVPDLPDDCCNTLVEWDKNLEKLMACEEAKDEEIKQIYAARCLCGGFDDVIVELEAAIKEEQGTIGDCKDDQQCICKLTEDVEEKLKKAEAQENCGSYVDKVVELVKKTAFPT